MIAIKLRGAPSGPFLTGGNTGDVVTKNADGSVSFQPGGGGGGGAVSSVFGRAGAVVGLAGDYDASEITNNSSVAGATVKDALNALASGGVVVTNASNGLAPQITVANGALVANGAGTAAAWALLTSASLVGGLREVPDLAGRNAIPAANRAVGMTVYEVDTQQMWRLVGGILNANWSDVTVTTVSTAAAGIVPALGAGNRVLSANGASASWTNTLALDTTPATAGTVRLPALASVQFRDFANGRDLLMWRSSGDASNVQRFGDFTVGYTVQIESGLGVQLAAGNPLGGQTSFAVSSTQANLFVNLLQFQFATANQTVIANVNLGAGSSIVGADIVLRAAGNITAAQDGGAVRIQGGRAGAGGRFGGVKLQLNSDDTVGNMQTLVEVRMLATGRRVVALNRASDITVTEMPASTGDLVTYIGNAAALPAANPVSGGILYADAGALKYRGSAGTVTTLGPP